MRGAGTIMRRELDALIGTPLAAIFIVLFLLLSQGLYLYAGNNIFLTNELDLRGFFSMMPIILVFFLPAFTMGQWSEERKLGTIEILHTLPVSDFALIAGKFLGCFIFFGIALLFTLPLPLVLCGLGDLDSGQVLACYLGTLVLGGSYISFGLFVSSLTREPLVAFLVTACTLFFINLLGYPIVTSYIPTSVVPLFHLLSFQTHFESIARGVLDLRDIVYFLMMMAVSCYLNTLSLMQRKT